MNDLDMIPVASIITGGISCAVIQLAHPAIHFLSSYLYGTVSSSGMEYSSNKHGSFLSRYSNSKINYTFDVTVYSLLHFFIFNIKFNGIHFHICCVSAWSVLLS
jgi:hypothetical protein